MGIRTDIPWTCATWNPWQGCHRVSRACDNCYMYSQKIMYGQDPTTVVRSKDATFYSPYAWQRNKKLPDDAFVFVCSWSDFFITEADKWREEALEVMDDTPYTYLLLTKRPERIRPGSVTEYENVWLGVTAEDQDWYVRRWDRVRQVLAARHFISWEPGLGRIDLKGCKGKYLPDWVIAGCENGSRRRATLIDDIRHLRDQCVELEIPFFLKQMDVGGKVVGMPELDGKVWAQNPR